MWFKTSTFLLAAYLILALQARAETIDDESGSVSNCDKDIKTACSPPNKPPLTTPPENEDELDYFCSIELKYMPCARNYLITCNGTYDYEELFDKYYPTVVRMCDKDSALHKALVRNINCIAKILNTESERCDKEIEAVEHAYLTYVQNDTDGATAKRFQDMKGDELYIYLCLYGASYYACILRNVEECGIEAKEVSLDVIKSTGMYNEACIVDTNVVFNVMGNLGLDYYQEKSIREVLLMGELK